MTMSLTDANGDAADPDFNIFGDDHRLVAGVQRTGKCRHGQEGNNKQRKQNILHDILFRSGDSSSR
jgi:hypothetical protein